MILNTRNFGEIDISEDKIIHFPDGILAFEDNKRFTIINNEDESNPFEWLQSIDDTDLAFVIINPFIFKKDYDINIPEKVVNKLKIESEKDVLIYSIVVVPEDINNITANLAGPIIININKKLGKQIILEDKKYNSKHRIFDELQLMEEEGSC